MMMVEDGVKSRVNSLELVGDSTAFRQVISQLHRVARGDGTVLLVGESGTGKRLLVEAIHALSSRAAGPFVSLHCGMTSPTQLDGELFGRGPAAVSSSAIERARDGTLFLEEFVELPGPAQAHLLRLLEAESEPLSEVRLIVGTRRNPLAAVSAGELSPELLFRLAMFPIEVPPLRARGDDSRLLAQYFLDQLNLEHGTAKQLSPASLRTLKLHAWPGNVRELYEAVQRAHALAGNIIDLAPLVTVPRSLEDEAARSELRVPVGARLDEVERMVIEATLQRFAGNKRRTAEVLGCSLKTLYNKLNGYNREAHYAQA